MTHTRLLFTATIVCAGVAACKSNNAASTDSASGMAATNAPASTPGVMPAPAAMTPTTDSGARTAAPGGLPTIDSGILGKVQAGDSAEVAVATYVTRNGTSAAVKSFATMLERDHGKGISTLEVVAKKNGVAIQAPPGDTTAQETSHVLDHLKSLNGMDRDTAFINHEIDDHQHDIADTKQMASNAQNPDVRSMLEKELPELQKHLDRAQQVSRELNAKKK